MIEIDDLTIRLAAVTIRGEAEGEGEAGMTMIAWGIRNRAKRRRQSVAEVVLAPLQISFWNGDSRRRARLLTDNGEAHRRAEALFIEVWFADLDDDPTNGADHWNTLDSDPLWDDDMLLTVTWKNHEFFDSTRHSDGTPYA